MIGCLWTRVRKQSIIVIYFEFETELKFYNLGAWSYSLSFWDMLRMYHSGVTPNETFCGSFLLFMFHICLYYTALSVSCSLVITCWERTDPFALLCVMFPCVFVSSPYGVLGKVWYLIVSIPALCLLFFSTCLVTSEIQYMCIYWWQSNTINLNWKVKSQAWPLVVVYSHYHIIYLTKYDRRWRHRPPLHH